MEVFVKLASAYTRECYGQGKPERLAGDAGDGATGDELAVQLLAAAHRLCASCSQAGLLLDPTAVRHLASAAQSLLKPFVGAEEAAPWVHPAVLAAVALVSNIIVGAAYTHQYALDFKNPTAAAAAEAGGSSQAAFLQAIDEAVGSAGGSGVGGVTGNDVKELVNAAVRVSGGVVLCASRLLAAVCAGATDAAPGPYRTLAKAKACLTPAVMAGLRGAASGCCLLPLSFRRVALDTLGLALRVCCCTGDVLLPAGPAADGGVSVPGASATGRTVSGYALTFSEEVRTGARDAAAAACLALSRVRRAASAVTGTGGGYSTDPLPLLQTLLATARQVVAALPALAHDVPAVPATAFGINVLLGQLKGVCDDGSGGAGGSPAAFTAVAPPSSATCASSYSAVEGAGRAAGVLFDVACAVVARPLVLPLAGGPLFLSLPHHLTGVETWSLPVPALLHTLSVMTDATNLLHTGAPLAVVAALASAAFTSFRETLVRTGAGPRIVTGHRTHVVRIVSGLLQDRSVPLTLHLEAISTLLAALGASTPTGEASPSGLGLFVAGSEAEALLTGPLVRACVGALLHYGAGTTLPAVPGVPLVSAPLALTAVSALTALVSQSAAVLPDGVRLAVERAAVTVALGSHPWARAASNLMAYSAVPLREGAAVDARLAAAGVTSHSSGAGAAPAAAAQAGAKRGRAGFDATAIPASSTSACIDSLRQTLSHTSLPLVPAPGPAPPFMAASVAGTSARPSAAGEVSSTEATVAVLAAPRRLPVEVAAALVTLLGACTSEPWQSGAWSPLLPILREASAACAAAAGGCGAAGLASSSSSSSSEHSSSVLRSLNTSLASLASASEAVATRASGGGIAAGGGFAGPRPGVAGVEGLGVGIGSAATLAKAADSKEFRAAYDVHGPKELVGAAHAESGGAAGASEPGSAMHVMPLAPAAAPVVAPVAAAPFSFAGASAAASEATFTPLAAPAPAPAPVAAPAPPASSAAADDDDDEFPDIV